MKIGGSNVMWIGHPLFGEEKAIILLDSFFFFWPCLQYVARDRTHTTTVTTLDP